MATTGQKIATGGALGLVLIAAAAIGPVTDYFEPERTQADISVAYQDMNGRGHPWTICNGHTRDVKPGDRATRAQCIKYRDEDSLAAAQTVMRCLPMLTDPDHVGSLGDAALNIGPDVVCGSTLQKKAQAGDFYGMCMQLTDATGKDGWPDGWTKGGGVRLKGLVLRRIYDRDWCLGHKHKGFP